MAPSRWGSAVGPASRSSPKTHGTNNLKKLDGIDIHIVHGRSDHVCIPRAAWRLVKGLEAVGHPCAVNFVAGAGHSDSEPGNAAALREATDALRSATSRATLP